jgi:glucose/arabinose dehydrogenase
MRRRTAVFACLLILASIAVPATDPTPATAANPTGRFMGEQQVGSSGQAPAVAPVTQSGFQDTVAFSGLTFPTAIRFASDGRIFVSEKSGLIKVFDNLSDPTPTVYANLGGEVDDYWDRGLLSMTLDPNFPASPYIYVAYALDAAVGGTPPRWNDACPSPPGPTTDGCPIGARVSRLTVSGTTAGSEQVLVEDWCQQYPSHSIGDVRFGPDGALYVSGGEGANFLSVDYGQFGGSAGSPVPKNPCGDPPSERREVGVDRGDQQ